MEIKVNNMCWGSGMMGYGGFGGGGLMMLLFYLFFLKKPGTTENPTVTYLEEKLKKCC